METAKDIFAVIGIVATISLISGIAIAWIIKRWTDEK